MSEQGLFELLESLPVPPREWRRSRQRLARKRVGIELNMDYLKMDYGEELGLVTREQLYAAESVQVRRMLSEVEDGTR